MKHRGYTDEAILEIQGWGFNTKRVQAGQEHADPAAGADACLSIRIHTHPTVRIQQKARFALRRSWFIYSRLGNPY